jgi:sulfur carrier protein
MTVKVNGESVTCKENDTMKDLIAALDLEGKVMAAAVNMNIVKQDVWDKHQLKSDDVVELLDFVGGG